ncbi:methyltransferase domain-containing protein [Microcoleus sp.]|uniref:class I SAM-dependent methyltransferase n=1 Tax=Microcoleus sp. TaxID=44472 RepID=UPI0035248CC8
MKCNLCGYDSLIQLGDIGLKPNSVTSEPDLCSLAAKIYYCQNCHHLQKAHTEKELSFINSLYQNYETYKVSSGKEQLVFPKDSPPRPRSYHAIEQCISSLPKSGNLLDIGTGNGAILRSASQLLQQWQLFAFDLGEKSKEEILAISGVVEFYAESLENVPKGKFNLIVLWHSLEHIPEPAQFLTKLKNYLTEEGFLLIQVPDIHRTPFDFAVIDHWSHFTNSALIKLCQETGYQIELDGYDWVHNCLTLLLKRDDGSIPKQSLPDSSFTPDGYFYWLKQTVEEFERATQNRKYAIFGTGISGIWVSSQLSNPPSCFIDEDSQRVGNNIGNIPIVKPQEIPPGMDIVMPFTPATGKNISKKMQQEYSTSQSSNFILSQPYLKGDSH